MSFLDRLRSLHQFDPASYVPFLVGDLQVGLIGQNFVEPLRAFPETFVVSDYSVAVSDALSTSETRTRAIDSVLRHLFDQGWFPGWRDEPYSVGEDIDKPVLFEMERAAIPLFGVRACGVHVNGFVRDGSDLHMWVGRRARDKRIEPGKLDQLVAGGQHAGLTTQETVIKEAAEEANLPAALAAAAVSVGAITYRTERPEGLRRDVLYTFDLELPPSFRPVNTDGEMEEFFLWPLEKVIATVESTDAFKFNCAPVVIDFLIRHGYLGPDHPDFLALVRALHGD